jgi:hypothetical protein
MKGETTKQLGDVRTHMVMTVFANAEIGSGLAIWLDEQSL